MDYFQQQINQWADWQAVQTQETTFTPLVRQIYASEHVTFETLVSVPSDFAAVFQVGSTNIAIFPPESIAPDTRDRYQTERFSLTRARQLGLTTPTLQHAGFIFDAYQFYYVIYRPLAGVTLTAFKTTAKASAKVIVGQQIAQALSQLNGDVASFNQFDAAKASAAAAWQQLGPDFAAERSAYLVEHPVNGAQFVHGHLTGEQVIVTAGQIGFQGFETAYQAPKVVELVPLLLGAFAGDADLLAGFQKEPAELVPDLLLGLLWRVDGPQWIQQLVGTTPVTLAMVSAALTAALNRK